MNPPQVRRPAFTLLEILLVLALIAVLSTLTLTSLAGALRTATLDDVAARIAFADAATRTLARTTGRPVSLAYDSATNTVSRVEPNVPPAAVVRLPAQFRVTRIRTAGAANPPEIPFTPQGHSPTYAVHLQSKDAHRWLLFPGLTGAATTINDDRTLDVLLSTEAPARP